MDPGLRLGGGGTSGSISSLHLTQPRRWPSSRRGSSSGVAKSRLLFCRRIQPSWTQAASRIFLLTGLCKAGRERIWKKMETGGYRCLWQILLNRAVPIIGNFSPGGLHKVYSRIRCLNCDVITRSSCSYHKIRKRNYKINLKAYINKFIRCFDFDSWLLLTLLDSFQILSLETFSSVNSL